MSNRDTPSPVLGRRAVVAGAGALGAGLAVAGCSTVEVPPAGSEGGGAPAGTVLGSTADVPVGGGAIFAEQQVVVTQLAAGEFVGLSAVCTHQQCTVGSIEGGEIVCPCHGSRYALDGTVVSPPAPRPLESRPVTVEGDQIILG